MNMNTMFNEQARLGGMPTDMYRGMQAVGGRVTRGVGGMFFSDESNTSPATGTAAEGTGGANRIGGGGGGGADDDLAAATAEGEDEASARTSGSPRHRRTRSGGSGKMGALARTRASGGNIKRVGSPPTGGTVVDGSAQTKAKEIVVLLEVFRKGPGRYHIFVVSTHRVMCCEGGQGDTYKVGRVQ